MSAVDDSVLSYLPWVTVHLYVHDTITGTSWSNGSIQWLQNKYSVDLLSFA